MGLIISQILGGLGNQMFQYAAARAASLSSGKSLKLDTSRFLNYELHNGFELLSVFNFSVEIATNADIRKVLGVQSGPLVQRIVSRPSMQWLRSSNFVSEPQHNYWPGINNLPRLSYLVGYWQSEKYFEKYKDLIRKEFVFKDELSPVNQVVANKILNTSSVSLHVRRGDYVSSKITNAVHGVCSLAYYKNAIQYVAERVDEPFFYIFSDDVDWVRANLQVNFPCEYIAHNGGVNSNVDMHLMSLCKHNIIANSSFSWWGAWLNSNSNKIVIAPGKWFANALSTEDVVSGEWTVL